MIGSTDSSPIMSFDQKAEEDRTPVGKRILIGIAYCNHQDEVVSREQIYGIIERINAKEGVAVKVNGSNEIRVVPLDASSFQMARPGQYTLSGSGEVIEDPDYTMRVTLYAESK